MDKIGGSVCPECGAWISPGMTLCLACGERLPQRAHPDSTRTGAPRNWRQRAAVPAAILMFLIGVGLLIWAAIRLFVVTVFGGSLSEVWWLLLVAVLPFLVGWDFLPGTRRNADPTSANASFPRPKSPNRPE